jgi:hypothetical protein
LNTRSFVVLPNVPMPPTPRALRRRPRVMTMLPVKSWVVFYQSQVAVSAVEWLYSTLPKPVIFP